MTDTSQTGMHLDADQLAAFGENALPPHERELCLAHLASCARCREIAFLAQDPESQTATAPLAKPALPRIMSFNIWALAGIAFACFIVMTIAIHKRRGGEPAAPSQIAVNTPAPPPPTPSLQQDESPKKTTAMATRIPAPAPPPPSIQQSGMPPQSLPDIPAHESKQEFVPSAAPPPPSNSFVADNGASKAAGRASAVNETGRRQSSVEAVIAGAAAAPAPELARKAAAPVQPQQQSTSMDSATAIPPRSRDAAKQSDVVTLNANTTNLPMENRSLAKMAEGGVSGVITDIAGASIPGAIISLQQIEGTVHRQATTAADGTFTIAAIPPGRYRVEITRPGFLTQVQQLEVSAKQMAQLEPHLSVGAATETVEVASVNAAVATGEISALPDHMPARVTKSLGKYMLALDDDGRLFSSSNRGRTWKLVRPVWSGRITTIDVAPGEPDARSEEADAVHKTQRAGLSFRATSSAGAVLMSRDGQHWKILSSR